MTGDSKLHVIIKRPELRERFVVQYNPVLLLAAKGKTSIELIMVNKGTNIRNLVCAKNSMPDTLEEFSGG